MSGLAPPAQPKAAASSFTCAKRPAALILRLFVSSIRRTQVLVQQGHWVRHAAKSRRSAAGDMSGRTHPMAAARPAFRDVKSFVSHEHSRRWLCPAFAKKWCFRGISSAGRFATCPPAQPRAAASSLTSAKRPAELILRPRPIHSGGCVSAPARVHPSLMTVRHKSPQALEPPALTVNRRWRHPRQLLLCSSSRITSRSSSLTASTSKLRRSVSLISVW